MLFCGKVHLSFGEVDFFLHHLVIKKALHLDAEKCILRHGLPLAVTFAASCTISLKGCAPPKTEYHVQNTQRREP